ncbi:MAG: ISKra4 family transposase, partial [Armatimonadetes bacterium]|nr:ISKra4 family transposase [Armatimonadota bacterium]
MYESLVRLGTWMPFGRAAEMLAAFTGVQVSDDVAQARTETAGAAQVALQTAEVERLEREAPAAPPGPDQQYLSADGAFVPLVGGEWAEVKSVVIGEVGEPVQEKGEWVVHTRHLSYFSRLADAETFDHLALVETHRRGVENAGQVAAVLDGAEWLQGFVDWHRPDAVRILDFPHASGYVSQIGQAQFGADSPDLAAWLQTELHQLKHQGPEGVLAELRDLVAEHPQAEALELPKALAYLEKRQAQMQYPLFQAQGWPLASGATESGNKRVVEARLKGAGMHWARAHVDPMLALRNVACNDRWDEAWPQIAAELRQQARDQRAARRQRRRAAVQTRPAAE